MFVRFPLLLISLLLLLSCNSHNPHGLLNEQEYAQLVQDLTPYVNKKPDGVSDADRFSERLRPYYARIQQSTEGRLRFYTQKDSLHYFYYVRRDHTSLFEHYYGFGGVFTKDDRGKIQYLNLFFQSPRLTKAEEEQRGEELFKELMATGHTDKYIGNRDYIKTPNADFYYNSAENRWDYTENSSWIFMQEAKAEAEQNSEL